MWISRTAYNAGVAAATEAQVLRAQNVALNTTMEWFRFRLAQCEMERSIFVKHYMGVDVPVPQVAASAREGPGIVELLQRGGDLFGDVSDKDAERQGLTWDDKGAVIES